MLLALIIFLCILSVLFCRWHIDIDNKRIEYCSISGKNNYCYYNQITKAEVDEKNNMYIYSENGNVLKIPIEISDTYIIKMLRYQGVCVKYKYNIDDFMMKLPLFYPILYMFFSVLAGVLFIFSIGVNTLASIFWTIIMLATIYRTISDFWLKVIVKGNEIVQIRFFRKAKRISHKKIVKVISREKDNLPYIYIYSEKGLEMKINMLCENKKLMEELIKRHHWESERT